MPFMKAQSLVSEKIFTASRDHFDRLEVVDGKSGVGPDPLREQAAA